MPRVLSVVTRRREAPPLLERVRRGLGREGATASASASTPVPVFCGAGLGRFRAELRRPPLALAPAVSVALGCGFEGCDSEGFGSEGPLVPDDSPLSAAPVAGAGVGVGVGEVGVAFAAAFAVAVAVAVAASAVGSSSP